MHFIWPGNSQPPFISQASPHLNNWPHTSFSMVRIIPNSLIVWPITSKDQFWGTNDHGVCLRLHLNLKCLWKYGSQWLLYKNWIYIGRAEIFKTPSPLWAFKISIIVYSGLLCWSQDCWARPATTHDRANKHHTGLRLPAFQSPGGGWARVFSTSRAKPR